MNDYKTENKYHEDLEARKIKEKTEKIKKKKAKEEKAEGPKRSFTFPWYFRIVALILSYACMIVCAFFVIVKGLEFGNSKVTSWVTSLAISFVTSVLFHEPIKVN